MSPGVHLLASWLSTVPLLHNRRERVIVSLSGIAPDIDGIGIVIDQITGTTTYFHEYHHYIGHNIVFALACATLASLLARTQKNTVWLLSFGVLHLHYLCDLIGSRGPDHYQWPIYYFYPFNTSYGVTWSGQWALNAWQNQLIMSLLLLLCVYSAKRKNITFFEIFSKRLEEAAINLYRKYFRRS